MKLDHRQRRKGIYAKYTSHSIFLQEILRAENLKKYFRLSRGFMSSMRHGSVSLVKAVDGISLKLDEGQVYVIAGESGSGKSTLARLLLRAIEPDEGRIIFKGSNIEKKKDADLKEFRRSVQMVHQDAYTSLDPRMKILDIIMEPISIHEKGSSRRERQEKAYKALEAVKLEPVVELSNNYPYSLSGGQRQRVALARALVLRPAVIIADEPVSMLDVSVRAGILELMKDLKDRFRISYVYITHDLSTSRYIGDKIAIMYAGKIVEMGHIDTVLLNPLHPYTQALIDAVSEPNPTNLQETRSIRIRDGAKTFSGGCNFYFRCLYSMDKCKKEPILRNLRKRNQIENGNDHFVSCFLYD
ncbi:MAG TPA: ABC transporter ATP-binding protein [Nitrososphaeraceae archaeon]|nr:ABC transporter ATP-binding protein [Nitrososphaeraceae archaeon]